MNATAENGFLPAFTADQLAEVSAKEATKHVKTLTEFCKGNFEAVQDHLADLAQSFALGACEAAHKAKDGEAVRSYQWKYGNGFMLKRLHEILSEIVAASKNIPIDHTGGAMANGEDRDEAEETPGYVLESGEEVTDCLINADNLAAAQTAFAGLPADLRQVVQLNVIEGKSAREIAKELGISYPTAWRMCRDGIELMRRQFAA